MVNLLGGRPGDVALIDAVTGESIDYRSLEALVRERTDELAVAPGSLVFLGVEPTVASVVTFIAMLRLPVTVVPMDSATSFDRVAAWADAYRPDLVLGVDGPHSSAIRRLGTDPQERVLLTTSGSTGSPKFVRLSAANIAANADQIGEALDIRATDRAISHLAFHYSYGLSVLTSHLRRGASIVLTPARPTQPEFVDAMARHQVTSLAGVPFSFEVFRRTGLFDRTLPHLRAVTVAGGRLPTPRIVEVGTQLAARGSGLWTMYGATEATARISILPPTELPEQAGSVGYALDRETITIADPEDGSGEIIVTGPNVMLGYATSHDDLGCGDLQHGTFATGDLGHLDATGRLWVTGRIKRIAKPFGVRISLDEVESALADHGIVAVVERDDRIVAIATTTTAPAASLERLAGLPMGSLRVEVVESVTRTAHGKVDYTALLAALAGEH